MHKDAEAASGRQTAAEEDYRCGWDGGVMGGMKLKDFTIYDRSEEHTSELQSQR